MQSILPSLLPSLLPSFLPSLACLHVPALPVLEVLISRVEASVVPLLDDDKCQGGVILRVDPRAGGLDSRHLWVGGEGGREGGVRHFNQQHMREGGREGSDISIDST